MKQSDRGKFGEVLAMLGSTFDKHVDKGMLEGYWMALEDLPLESIVSAVNRSTKGSRWFPRPVELRELAGAADVLSRARLAWIETAEAAKSSSMPNDPIARETVNAMGGPRRLGNMEVEQLMEWGKKRFEETYVLLAGTKAARQLAGEIETEQLQDGAKKITAELSAKLGIGEKNERAQHARAHELARG